MVCCFLVERKLVVVVVVVVQPQVLVQWVKAVEEVVLILQEQR